MSIATNQPEIEAYVAGIVESAAGIRLPELLEIDHPDVIYRVPDRNGVGTVILPTTLLTEEQLVKLLRYRMAQYMMVGFVDLEYAYEHQLEHEPASAVNPDDLHVVAMSSETGEMLCYATVEAPPTDDPTFTLRDRERPLFPAEQVHGWGIYNRLRILPDLPLVKLRELGRFVKNHRLHAFDELGARGAIEVGVAIFRSMAGRLRLDVEAIIGDFEEGVAMQNLEFFHAPMVVIHGTIPYYPEAAYLYPRYQFRTVYPFAALSADVSKHMLSRLDAIEAALAQPGKQGMLALFALKREGSVARSGLEPPGGLAELSQARLEQVDRPMPMRLEMLAAGDRLRQTNLFGGLSVSEAAILGTFMERIDKQEGDYIVRQGEMTDSLYLIESGEAEVRITGDEDKSTLVARLGPGEYVGEIALLTGEPRMADVIAATPMVLLQLTRDAYTRYLSHALEVEQNITRTALSRTRETARHMTNNRE
jgi:hypothetical protein